MRKLLIIIFALILCDTAYANNNLAFDLPKKEGIKLITGQKNISLLIFTNTSEKDILKNDVISDIELKLRLIGLETSDIKWNVPILLISLGLVDVANALYSGKIELSFLMIAEYHKEKVRSYATVWKDNRIFTNGDKQQIRNFIKDMMDKFLTVYLEENKRKFMNNTP